ncbi:MAG: hypothetical protein ACOH2R_28535 [Pseudomonas sp.]
MGLRPRLLKPATNITDGGLQSAIELETKVSRRAIVFRLFPLFAMANQDGWVHFYTNDVAPLYQSGLKYRLSHKKDGGGSNRQQIAQGTRRSARLITHLQEL